MNNKTLQINKEFNLRSEEQKNNFLCHFNIFFINF